jgi:hypothetical protein
MTLLTWSIGSIRRHAFTCDVAFLASVGRRTTHDCGTVFRKTLLILQRRLPLVRRQGSSRPKVVSRQRWASSVARPAFFDRFRVDGAEVVCWSKFVPQEMSEFFRFGQDGVADIATNIFETLECKNIPILLWLNTKPHFISSEMSLLLKKFLVLSTLVFASVHLWLFL